ncbi:hypothetical protein [Bartonella melophagi]|uniref:hypothetical protein n=1 Tax=Bartonella melophagi TaxID=291176 RepID=UPI00030598E9|nr:hypothetical protein [Bartonella melophagi]
MQAERSAGYGERVFEDESGGGVSVGGCISWEERGEGLKFRRGGGLKGRVEKKGVGMNWE